MSEIDLKLCRSYGINVVRRITGGRAVLHNAELTYSIIVREDYPLIPKTITASYHYFSSGIVAGLDKLGVKAQMSVPVSAYGKRTKEHGSAACFATPSHYEITNEGRKLVGSAQVRKNGVILQHGSVLLKSCTEELVTLLRLSSVEKRERMIQLLNQRVISLEEILQRDVTWQEVYCSMADAFGIALGIKLELGNLTVTEQLVSDELALTKYSQDNWNLLR